MKRLLLFLLAAGVAVAWKIAGASRGKPTALIVHCAAGLRAPVEELAHQFEAGSGIPVQIQFGGSQQLLSGISLAKRGDVFIPADDSYLAGVGVREAFPLAQMSIVVAVKKGNPLKVLALSDLMRPDVRVGLPDPDFAATGKLARTMLGAQWTELAGKAIVTTPTVNEVANALKLGSVDAGIVFDIVAAQYPDLEIIALPELASAKAHVAAVVLTASKQPAQASQFVRFLASAETGAAVFRRYGFGK